MKNYRILVMLFIISFFSCEEDATIDLPKTEAQLVIASFISPQDSILLVKATKSFPFYSERPSFNYNGSIKDATVKIYDETNEVLLSYDSTIRHYIADADPLSIEAGKTYFIEVSTPEGLKATGSCTVPFPNNTLTVELEKENDDSGNVNYDITTNWAETSQENFAYRIYSEVEMKFTQQDTTVIYYQPIYIGDNDLLRSGGTNYTQQFSYYHFTDIDDENKFYFFLLTIDEHYFKYHISAQNQNVENPFAEPVSIYSNIEGGLGVFAAYNKFVITKEF